MTSVQREKGKKMEREFILKAFTDDGIEYCIKTNMQEVVRCKDCRHSFTGNYFKGYACKRLSGEHTFTVSSDGFCSKGERRE